MNNFNLLMAAQFAFFDRDLTFGHAELFGEKFHQMGIRLAVNRRGGDGDFYLVAMQTDNGGTAGFPLNIKP